MAQTNYTKEMAAALQKQLDYILSGQATIDKYVDGALTDIITNIIEDKYQDLIDEIDAIITTKMNNKDFIEKIAVDILSDYSKGGGWC